MFVGTWQEREPCKNNYRWMRLREKDGALQGEWAAALDIWGLMTGGVRATPDGGFLRTLTCLETYDLPRYAAFFSKCPTYQHQDNERGLRIDEATGELLLVASPGGGVISRMRKVDASSVPPAACSSVED